MTEPTATFIHLSDLHLGAELEDVGSREKASLKWLPKLGGLRMQAHDPYIISSLSTGILRAARFVRSPNDIFDFAFVTGDISTNSDPDKRFALPNSSSLARSAPRPP